MAPSVNVFEGSGTTRVRSISTARPHPPHSGQAPRVRRLVRAAGGGAGVGGVDRGAAVPADGPAGAGEEEAEAVVGLGDGPDGAPARPLPLPLPDGDGRRDAVDGVGVGLVEP